MFAATRPPPPSGKYYYRYMCVSFIRSILTCPNLHYPLCDLPKLGTCWTYRSSTAICFYKSNDTPQFKTGRHHNLGHRLYLGHCMVRIRLPIHLSPLWFPHLLPFRILGSSCRDVLVTLFRHRHAHFGRPQSPNACASRRSRCVLTAIVTLFLDAIFHSLTYELLTGLPLQVCAYRPSSDSKQVYSLNNSPLELYLSRYSRRSNKYVILQTVCSETYD